MSSSRSFTKQYGVRLLVHFEYFDTMPDAISREKRLKKLTRAEKIALIEKQNTELLDLTQEIQAWRE